MNNEPATLTDTSSSVSKSRSGSGTLERYAFDYLQNEDDRKKNKQRSSLYLREAVFCQFSTWVKAEVCSSSGTPQVSPSLQSHSPLCVIIVNFAEYYWSEDFLDSKNLLYFAIT